MNTIIKTSTDLETLHNKICWDDSELINCYMGKSPQSYYPENDYIPPFPVLQNHHLLYRVCCGEKEYLDLIFIGCNTTSINAGMCPTVDIKKVDNYWQLSDKIYCKDIIYKYVDIPDFDDALNYYRVAGVIEYRNNSKIKDGYNHIKIGSDSLFIEKQEDQVELSISKNGALSSVLLSHDQIINLSETLHQLTNQS